MRAALVALALLTGCAELRPHVPTFAELAPSGAEVALLGAAGGMMAADAANSARLMRQYSNAYEADPVVAAIGGRKPSGGTYAAIASGAFVSMLVGWALPSFLFNEKHARRVRWILPGLVVAGESINLIGMAVAEGNQK